MLNKFLIYLIFFHITLSYVLYAQTPANNNATFCDAQDISALCIEFRNIEKELIKKEQEIIKLNDIKNFTAAGAVIVGAVLTFFLSMLLRSNEDKNFKKLKEEFKEVSTRKSMLESQIVKYTQSFTTIKAYNINVLLIGPTDVGKSSLMRQWNSSWEESNPSATTTVKEKVVPIYKSENRHTFKHSIFGVDCMRKAEVNFNVFDFPGEKDKRHYIIQKLKNITENAYEKPTTAIVILFDTAEDNMTNLDMYFDNEFFDQLKELIVYENLTINSVVFVFNKIDKITKDFSDINNLKEVTKRKFNKYTEKILEYFNKGTKIHRTFTALDPKNHISIGESAVKAAIMRDYLNYLPSSLSQELLDSIIAGQDGLFDISE